MKPNSKFSERSSQWPPLLLCGVGVGILTGLSASPVIKGVLTAILGVLSGLLAGAAGLSFRGGPSDEQGGGAPPLERSAPFRVDATPCAVFILGVVLGGTSGIFVRTHNWLGVPDTAVATNAALQTPQEHANVLLYVPVADADVLKALLRETNPTSPPSPTHPAEADTSSHTSTTQGSFYFTVPASECTIFLDAQDDALPAQMQTSKSQFVRRFAANSSDTASLRTLVRTLCHASH